MLNFTESNMAESEQRRWYAVDDGVMGGVSQSGFRVEAGAGCFCGEVSLENGGGLPQCAVNPTALNRPWLMAKELCFVCVAMVAPIS